MENLVPLKNDRGVWHRREHKWHSEEELYDFLRSFVSLVKPKTCLETGTFTGAASLAISDALEGISEDAGLVTIEKDPRQIDPELYKRKNIELVIGESPKDIPVRDYDFAFLDSNHTYEQISAELVAVLGMIKRGFIVVHDVYHEKWGDGLRKALMDEVEITDDYILLPSYNGLAIIQVKQ